MLSFLNSQKKIEKKQKIQMLPVSFLNLQKNIRKKKVKLLSFLN